tara:strand:- start:19046 stop:20014 length:969 start_codon:yes stop_codon:yes gene_type:complete
MKKILIAGPGCSGSGAVLDFLKARNDTFIPFKDEEFRIVNDPSGINNLEKNFYDNFSINNSSDCYAKFNQFCKKLTKFKNRQNQKTYPKEFKNIYKKYLSEIIYLSYNGMPRFQKFNLNLIDKIIFYFSSIVLKKKIENINLYKMILPIEKSNFVNISKKFIEDILFYSNDKIDNKIAIIDQGVNIFNLNENLKYFSNSKCILTVRDPRGTFHTLMKLKKQNIAQAYQGMDLIKFVEWYKFIYDKIIQIELNKNNTLIVKFEDFIINHHSTSKKIFDFLNLESQNTSFNIKKSLTNVNDVEKEIGEKNLQYIKSKLKDYLTY